METNKDAMYHERSALSGLYVRGAATIYIYDAGMYFGRKRVAANGGEESAPPKKDYPGTRHQYTLNCLPLGLGHRMEPFYECVTLKKIVLHTAFIRDTAGISLFRYLGEQRFE